MLDQMAGLSHEEIKEISSGELLKKLRDNSGTTAIRFASGISGYFVAYCPHEDELKIMAAGPHGPETRLLVLDEIDFSVLHKESERIDIVDISDSPLPNPSG